MACAREPFVRIRSPLLDLPQDNLEAIVLRYVAASALPHLRATCRQLKGIADRRLSHLMIPASDLPRHGFVTTRSLPSVTSLVLDLAAQAGPGLGPGLQPPVPMRVLLPPVALMGLRGCLPGLRFLTLRNTPGDPQRQPQHLPLDLAGGLQGLRLEGPASPAGSAEVDRHSHRPQGCFPLGLGPSLARAAPSLTSLCLSRVSFYGHDGDVLGLLTGLRELSIKSCYNATARGLTCLGKLTQLTSLDFEDVQYQTGIPGELVVLSALTRLRQANFRRADVYADEVAAWHTWAPSLTRLVLSSGWMETLNGAPQLARHLTALVELHLPSHALEADMWHLLVTRLPRLEAAWFRWVDLFHDDYWRRRAVEPMGAAAPGGPGGPGGPDGGNQPAAQEQQQEGAGGGVVGAVGDEVIGGFGFGAGRWWRPRPHLGLRRLTLDGPTMEAMCDWPLWDLFPRLEELRAAEDVEALEAIDRDDPNVCDRLHTWIGVARMLDDDGGGGGVGAAAGAAAAGAGAGTGTGGARVGCDQLRVLSAPVSWLSPGFMRLPGGCRNLRTLRLQPAQPSASLRQTAAFPPKFVEERAVETWRSFAPEERPTVPQRGVLAALGVPPFNPARGPLWPHLTRLEVPSDRDALALAPLCPAVTHLLVTREYGGELEGWVRGGGPDPDPDPDPGGRGGRPRGVRPPPSPPPPSRLLPALTELTLAGRLDMPAAAAAAVGVGGAGAWLEGLLPGLARLGVRRVWLRPETGLTPGRWAEVRRLRSVGVGGSEGEVGRGQDGALSDLEVGLLGGKGDPGADRWGRE